MVRFVLSYNAMFRIILLTLTLLCFQVSAAFAHTPHDVIDLVELSPAYDQDKTVFMYERSRLFKSTDGGYSWKQLVKGFEKRRSATAIAISPSYGVDGTVFLSSKGGGIYKSIDGGLSWTLMKNELSNEKIQLLAISPEYFQDNVLFASDQQGILYKTTNGGESFYKVDVGASIKAIAFSRDLKSKFICIGDAEGVLYVSMDSGDTWHRKIQISNSGAITTIAVSPSFMSDKTLVAGTEDGGVFISTDGGTSFQNSTKGIPDKYITSIVISPNYDKDSMIFVSSWYGVFGSNDGGKSWRKSSKGLTSDPQADEVRYKSPYFRVLRMSKNFAKDRTLFVAGFDGLFKSDNGAQSWIEVETLAVSHIKSVALSPAYKEDSTIGITALYGGVYISQDRGVNWEVRNRGLYQTRLPDIDISPNFASDHTLFTIDNWRFYKSINDGQHWQAMEIDRCPWGWTWSWKWRKRISSSLSRLGFPDDLLLTQLERVCRKNLFPWTIAISPEFKADHTIFFGTRAQGIYRSVDGGLNWSSPSIMGQNGWVTSLAISPDFPSDKTLFAGVRDEGIYKTIDGGDTWRMVYGSKAHNIFVATSPYFKIDKTVFAGTAEGLVKTTDGGNSWEKVGDSCCGGNASIKALAISPNYKKDKTIIVSVGGIGLFKSEDGAGSFVEIGTELINKNHAMRLLEFSPAYEMDQTIVGASHEDIFRSIDAGETWDLLKRPIRYQEWVDYIRYEGKWVPIQNASFSLMKAMHSDIPTSRAKFIFVGSGISWIGGKGNDHGIAKVYLDGKLKQSVNQFSSEQEFRVPVFSVSNLNEGPHSIEIEVTNTKHPQSSGYQIAIDAFDVVR